MNIWNFSSQISLFFVSTNLVLSVCPIFIVRFVCFVKPVNEIRSKSSNLVALLTGVYRAAKKPPLKPKHIVKRAQFCEYWIPRLESSESPVFLFSDEKLFHNTPTNEVQYVKRLNGERYAEDCVSYTASNGSNVSVNVWYYVGPFGKGPLFLAENRKWFDSEGRPTGHAGKPAGFDGESYERLLDEAILTIKAKMGNAKVILIQDNASIHCRILEEDKLKPRGEPKRTYVGEIYKKHGLELVAWPAKSPDLNVIERCHSLLSSALKERISKLKKKFVPKNKSDLFSLLKKLWDQIENEKVLNIYDSFLKRMKMVREVEGKNNLPL